MRAISIRMGSKASGMVTKLDFWPGYWIARFVRSDDIEKQAIDPAIMNHASLMVVRKSLLFRVWSSAMEIIVVADNPTMNQILFEEPPPSRAAGTRTGLSVRLAINGV